jgi:hypothetical protein
MVVSHDQLMHRMIEGFVRQHRLNAEANRAPLKALSRRSRRDSLSSIVGALFPAKRERVESSSRAAAQPVHVRTRATSLERQRCSAQSTRSKLLAGQRGVWPMPRRTPPCKRDRADRAGATSGSAREPSSPLMVPRFDLPLPRCDFDPGSTIG